MELKETMNCDVTKELVTKEQKQDLKQGSSKAIIETTALSQKQGSKYLLKDIHWTVKEREHWVVFGSNGCGKTTLLSTITGYRGHSSGEIMLFGEELTAQNAVALRSQIGFVSASYLDRCFRHESGLDVILSAKFGGFGRKIAIGDRDVIRARALLKAFGIAAKGDYPYELLSQGQKQRVLLARALMMPPKLLVLDEPLNGLDIYARDFFLNTLQEIVMTTEVTLIYVTHHAEEIMPYYQRAMILQNGMIYAQGALNDVLSEQTLSNYFAHETKARWQGERLYIGIGEQLKMARTIWE